MVIGYSIVVAIINLTDDSVQRFEKSFETDLSFDDDRLLYNNHHVLLEHANILSMFDDKITEYCENLGIEKSSVDIDEFEVASLTDRVDVYFEDDGDQTISLAPSIKAYVHPKNDALKVPVLYGSAYDATTIIWSWPDDMEYAHYLIEQPLDTTEDQPTIIATIPIGAKTYAETGLTPGTLYTRRLVNFTAEQTSVPSESVTVKTAQATPVVNSSDYNEVRNYDFTSDDSEREQQDERYEAFHSGIGHGNDLKVYKQMDAGHTQSFRAYYKVSGIRTQRERKYEQVGFRYKACLEGIEDVEEQEGEVTFDVRAYPREWIRLKDYSWATRPVQVRSKLECDVFLRKEVEATGTETIQKLSPVPQQEEVSHAPIIPGSEPIHIDREGYYIYKGGTNVRNIYLLFTLDATGSLLFLSVGRSVDLIMGFDNAQSDAQSSLLAQACGQSDADKRNASKSEWLKFIEPITNETIKSTEDTDDDEDSDSTDDQEENKTGYIRREAYKYLYGAHGSGMTPRAYGDGINSNLLNLTTSGDDFKVSGSIGAVTYIKDQISGIVADFVQYVNDLNAGVLTKEVWQTPETGGAPVLIKTKHPKRKKHEKVKLFFGVTAFGAYSYDLTDGWVEATLKKASKNIYNGGKYSIKKTIKNIVNKYVGEPTKTKKSDHNGKWTGLCYHSFAPENIPNSDDSSSRFAGTSYGDYMRQYTNWSAGILGATRFMKRHKQQIINNRTREIDGETYTTTQDQDCSMSLFFTDGFPNTYLNDNNKTISDSLGTIWDNDITAQTKYYSGGGKKYVNYATTRSSYAEEEIATNVAKYSDDYLDSFDLCVGAVCSLGSGKLKGTRSRTGTNNRFNGTQFCYTEYPSDGVPYSQKFMDEVKLNLATDKSLSNIITWDNSLQFGQEVIQKFQTKYATGEMREDFNVDDIDIEGTEDEPDPDPSHRIIDGYKITGYNYNPVDYAETYTYDIDDYKIAHITCDLPTFTFDDSVTPVTYRKEENRAVVLKENMLFQTNLTQQSVWELIEPKIYATSLYRNGYNKTIGTVEQNGEEDTFLVRNMYIQDTYVFNDGSEYTSGQYVYEDGMEGSVNVYTEIDKAETEYYGDDCYLIKKKSLAQGGNPVYIQGYTDAIIFDNTHYIEKELNAYDTPRVALLSPSTIPGDYEYVNRMNKSYTLAQAGGSGLISHCIKVIRMDPDVSLETSPDNGSGFAIVYNLTNFGECLTTPLIHTIFATIGLSYQSPILNYRFNLEDPEASTPLYEILPGSYEDSNFKHIVLLRVFYADNVYISNTENYVEQFGDTPLATTSSNFIDGPSDDTLTEGLYKWTLREWRDGYGNDNGWYIDNYLWFMSKKMIKTQPYYDELPGHNLDPFYGIVNNRYSDDNPSGKKNLRVQIPAFNIPTTVRDESVKIYLKITEFSPDDAIVSYKWSNPLPGTDSVTHVNGDYATFSSDSVKYKDVEYTDMLATIAMPTEEVTDGEPLESTYTIDKPDSPYTYHTYILEGHTNNSDVIATRYPPYLEFVDNKATFNTIYKAVMNATSKWSPRIHNGYYYINQHEYFAYSEFNVEANFETIDKKDYLNVDGYVSIDVFLRKLATGAEDYNVNKTTRAELLIDEDHFIWEEGKGVTLAKVIDGEFYDEWYSYIYTSPVISFPNELTEAGSINVGISFSDGSTGMSMKVRSYSVETGEWSPWTAFTNGTVPNVPLGCAYQVSFDMQPTMKTEEMFFEDYLCCYLDWKDDGSESSINVNTITDHISTGPDDADGMYVSKIIDLGCISSVRLSVFGENDYNNIDKRVRLFIAANDTDERYLYDENINWIEITDTDIWTSGRYYRYKIEIPAGKKCYWLHKEINTTKTSAILPYMSSMSMSGHYDPQDVTAEFIKTESFSIPSDMQPHEVISNVLRLIQDDVQLKGFENSDIETVTITSNAPVTIDYDNAMNNVRPGNALANNITATTVSEEYAIKTYNTPYIFSQVDLYGNEMVVISGVPEQYAPITVEDADGNPFVRLFDKSDVFLNTNEIRDGNYKYMNVVEEYTCDSDTKYYELRRNDYEPITVRVYVNAAELNTNSYQKVNHLIIFDTPLVSGDVIHVEYRVARSFIAIVDYKMGTTTIYPYNGYNMPKQPNSKYKVFFETNKKNNKFVADSLSLNPVYRTDYKGFIYLTDDHNEPDHINIWADPLYLKVGGYDSTDISIEVLDIQNNPIINTEVRIDCDYGILTIDDNKTDMNGVVHLVYESSYITAVDTLRARVLKDDGSELTAEINITSM